MSFDGGVDWSAVAESMEGDGYAVTAPFLSVSDCCRIRECYEDGQTSFRSTIDMARYNFGRGEYKYFAYPLPDAVQGLRETFYRHLVPIANRWEARLGNETVWPESLPALTRLCHEEGQCRPTPLILRYREGDYNCLHQDLYGPVHFPLQVIILLSAPGDEFAGGELVLVEQRPRMQSRPIVVHLEQGAAAIIPVRERPRMGKRGYHRAPMRHGVGEVLSGQRFTLGVIFHDAA
jgi:hypothetical protein